MFQRLAILSAVVVALGVAAGAVVVSAKSSAPPGGSVAAVDQAGPAAKGTMPANFRIEIDGIPVSTFERVALGSEIEVIEFLPGDGGPAIKVPGDASYRNIVLLTSPDNPALQPLWEWHNSIIEGGIDRRDGTIVALDRDGTEIARYNFFDGWPSKWEIPDIPVDGPDIAVEVIELAVEKVERE